MAKLIFGLMQSLDGYVDHMKLGPPVPAVAGDSLALVLGAAISTAVGAFGGRWLEHVPLKLIAGIGFIAIGVGSIVSHYRGG